MIFNVKLNEENLLKGFFKHFESRYKALYDAEHKLCFEQAKEIGKYKVLISQLEKEMRKTAGLSKRKEVEEFIKMIESEIGEEL